MTSPKGEPVGAVFGFTRDLLYLLEEKKPDYLFCAFDLPGKTFRHAMYVPYKMQRAAMHEDLVPQIPAIRRVIAALGLPALGCPSYEADDILATIARATEELGGQCFLVTGDKDCRQLITDRVKVFNIRKNEVFDRDRLQAEWGITPQQVVDFQALVGDAVDNVPGVPLIGPKLARQLLEQYGTLEAVLDHAGDVPGAKRKENLLKFRDQALLSRNWSASTPKFPSPSIGMPAAWAISTWPLRWRCSTISASAASARSSVRWLREQGTRDGGRGTRKTGRGERGERRGASLRFIPHPLSRIHPLPTPTPRPPTPTPRPPPPVPRPPPPVPRSHSPRRYARGVRGVSGPTRTAGVVFVRYRDYQHSAALGQAGRHVVRLERS